MRTHTGTYHKGRLVLDRPLKADRPLRVMVIVEDDATARTAADSSLAENPEETDWMLFSSQLLSDAYSDDEPDYSNVVLREQNPEFAPWKRGR